jgi:hypothetical protein
MFLYICPNAEGVSEKLTYQPITENWNIQTKLSKMHVIYLSYIPVGGSWHGIWWDLPRPSAAGLAWV